MQHGREKKKSREVSDSGGKPGGQARLYRVEEEGRYLPGKSEEHGAVACLMCAIATFQSPLRAIVTLSSWFAKCFLAKRRLCLLIL